MRTLGPAIDRMEVPAIEKIGGDQRSDPFHVLIAAMLSAQTKDAVTFDASTRLFGRAATPHAMMRLKVSDIERLIYPVSFYRNKARHVKEACRQLIARFDGRVPTAMDELLTLPGVGRKTRQFGLDRGAQKHREHMCRHPCSSDLEPAGVGQHEDAGADGIGAVRRGAPSLVGLGQSLSRDVGAERVPPRLSGVRPVCDRDAVSEDWSDSRRAVSGQCVIRRRVALSLVGAAISLQSRGRRSLRPPGIVRRTPVSIRLSPGFRVGA